VVINNKSVITRVTPEITVVTEHTESNYLDRRVLDKKLNKNPTMKTEQESI